MTSLICVKTFKPLEVLLSYERKRSSNEGVP